MTTTTELDAEAPAGEAEAIAVTAPDDDEDLLGGEDDLDEDDLEDGDAAAVAERWRTDAAAIRAERDRLVADAEQEIARIAAEAEAGAARLEADAAEADQQATHWQAIADQDAAIAALEQEIAGRSDRLAALRAEETALTAEADQLGARLAEFAAAREEAAQRLRGAPQIADVGESIEATIEANDTLAAIGHAEAPARARMDAVRSRLAEVRGTPTQRDPYGNWRGPASGIGEAEEEIARLTGRLEVLRRERAGLPPRGEAAQIAMRLIAEAPLPEGLAEDKAGTVKLLALGKVTTDLERLAQTSPEEYAQLRDHYLRAPEPEPERAPTVREALGLSPQQQPVPVQLPDGGWGVGFRVSGMPLPDGAVTRGR